MILWVHVAKPKPKLVRSCPEHSRLFHVERPFSLLGKDPHFEYHAHSNGHGSYGLTTEVGDVQDGTFPEQFIIGIDDGPADSKPCMLAKSLRHPHVRSLWETTVSVRECWGTSCLKF